MTTQDELVSLCNELQQEFDAAARNKAVWVADTKATIEYTLNALAKLPHSILRCYVQPGIFEGNEFVSLILATQKTVNSEKLRKGGTLHYVLNHRGKVLVMIEYPYVEDMVEQNSPMVINNAAYDPKEITRELIWEHFNQFLREMLRWESGAADVIGFKQIPRTDASSGESFGL